MTIALWMVETWRNGDAHDLVCFGPDKLAAGRYVVEMKAAGYQAAIWDMADRSKASGHA